MTLRTGGAFINSLQVHLSRLIAYATSADVKLQREVNIEEIMYTRNILQNVC